MTDVTALPEAERRSEAVNELFEELPPLVARGLLYVMLALLLTAALYSTIGRVSEVVTAHGSLVPLGQTRPLQAEAGGRVTRVVVQEGDPVSAGQALVYLDTETAAAHLAAARQELAIRQRELQDELAGKADAAQVAETRARLAAAERDEVAAERAQEGSMILAPMDGQVTRLNVHGIGESVQPGQTVAEVAPSGAPLVIEAMLANTDVGRVKIGQRVRIKVDAYPYQRYGTLEGEVTSISPDAAPDKSGGSAYRVVVTPAARKEIPLRLGLAATAEIVTTRRRIIELIVRTLRGES